MISEVIHKHVQMLLKSDAKKGTHKCANARVKPRHMYKRIFYLRTLRHAIKHVRMTTKLGKRRGWYYVKSSHYDENHSWQDEAFIGRQERTVPLLHNASGVENGRSGLTEVSRS
jgi:hypothetical protein